MPGTELSRVGAGVDLAHVASDRRWTAKTFASVAGALFVVVAASAAWMSLEYRHSEIRTRSWLAAWAHFDGRWYLRIARTGYMFGLRHGRVSFFPGYPLLVRAVSSLGVSFLFAGVSVTLLCGLAAAILFRLWLARRMSPAAARIALVTLLLYPYAFFLVGAVYADALFLAVAIGAFLAVERGHLWLAAALGAVATATRPVGIAVVIGIAALAWESSGTDRRRRLTHVAIVSLAATGLLVYCAYLAIRFDNPLAFATSETRWHQSPGLETFFKIPLLRKLADLGLSSRSLDYLVHPVIAVIAVMFVPHVFRRFGRPYGLYTLTVLLIPIVFTKDFYGMGRYVLAAFPCFGLIGERLAANRVTKTVVLSTSAVLLVVLTSLFARSHYLS